MAFTSKVTLLPLMLLLSMALVLFFCSVAMQQNSDCVTVSTSKCFYVEVEMKNRKLSSDEQLIKGGLHGSSSAVKAQNLEGSELRTVPSGPDPLHHNANPKKPRTP